MKRTIIKRWILGTVIVIGLIIIGVVIYKNKFSADENTSCRPVIISTLGVTPGSSNGYQTTVSFEVKTTASYPGYTSCAGYTKWFFQTSPANASGKMIVDKLVFNSSDIIAPQTNWTGSFMVTPGTTKVISMGINLTPPTGGATLPSSLMFTFTNLNGSSTGQISVPVQVALSNSAGTACDNNLTVTPTVTTIVGWQSDGNMFVDPTTLPTRSKVISLSVQQNQATCGTNQYQISLEALLGTSYPYNGAGYSQDTKTSEYSIRNSFVTDASGARISSLQLTGNQPKTISINVGVPMKPMTIANDHWDVSRNLFNVNLKYVSTGSANNGHGGKSKVVEIGSISYLGQEGNIVGSNSGSTGTGTGTGTGGSTNANVTVAPTVSLSAPVRYSNTSVMQSIQIKNNDTANNLKVTGVSILPSRSTPSTLINALYGAQIKVGTSLLPALPFTVPSGVSNIWLAQTGTPPYPNPATVTTPVNPLTNYFVSSMLQGGLNTASYAYSFCVQVTYNGTGSPVVGCYTNPGTPVDCSNPAIGMIGGINPPQSVTPGALVPITLSIQNNNTAAGCPTAFKVYVNVPANWSVVSSSSPLTQSNPSYITIPNIPFNGSFLPTITLKAPAQPVNGSQIAFKVMDTQNKGTNVTYTTSIINVAGTSVDSTMTCNLPTVTASPLSVSAVTGEGGLVTYTFTPVKTGGKSPCNPFSLRFSNSNATKVPTSFESFVNATRPLFLNSTTLTLGQIKVTNPNLVSSTTMLFNHTTALPEGLYSIYSTLMPSGGTGVANGPTVNFTAN